MGLKEYKAKRKFKNTPEPEGKVAKRRKGVLQFVIQKHKASHLHYDFRLEMEGVLKSWAIPKGPSLDPSVKRLAMMVEDHPIEYGSFEGIIPEGNYGAGTVMLWDNGYYYAADVKEGETDEQALLRGLKEGNLKFILEGNKLNGEFALVKLKKSAKGNEWLLIKKKDEFVSDIDITEKDRSVKTQRNLDEIKAGSGGTSSVWYSNGEHDGAIPEKASKAKFPYEIKPMMATLTDHAFDSQDWLFEIKWDGYRAIAEVNFNDVNIYSRNLLSFNDRFPSVTNSLEKLGVQAVFDGEICAVDENGRSDFQLIQNYQRTGKGNIVYFVFDILYYGGYDLQDVTLIERKKLLESLLPEGLNNIKYSDHIIAKGKEFFEVAKEKNLEGIIAKKIGSKYYENVRGKEWLKIKIICEQEAVVCGFTDPRGSRKKFGALVLGIYQNGKLVYIGHSGGGFNHKTLDETYSRLVPLITSESPFEDVPKTNAPVTWVKPELVCEVKFQEWTDEGIMRQPIFLGFRDDKSAKEVKKEITKEKNDEKIGSASKTEIEAQNTMGKVKTKKEKIGRSKSAGTKRSGLKNRDPHALRSELKEKIDSEGKRKSKQKEKIKFPAKKKYISAKDSLLIEDSFTDGDTNEAVVEVSGRSLTLSNLKKIFWPEEGYTKEDLLEYYHKIAPYILPYLTNRPENLRRNPNGYEQSFFQKDMPKTIPDWLQTEPIYSEHNKKEINYLVSNDEASLLYMVNLGCIEINPWLSRIESLDYPDYIVIDLDPHDVPFSSVIEVAHAVKEVLDRASVKGFCKTSGSKGLHIYIPMSAKYNYDQAKTFAELIASLTFRLVPEITSLERMPNKRKNKIYIDYLQNRKGQTLAAPYCVRPKPGATVSTPLEWSEVKNGLSLSDFNIKTIFKRLEKKGDIFQGIMGEGIDLEKVLERLKS